MMKTRDFFLLKDYFPLKQRAGYPDREPYEDAPDDGLTVPLPPSPVMAEEDSQLTGAVESTLTSGSVDAEEPSQSISTIAPQISAKLLALPPLETTMHRPDPDPDADKSPDTASSGTTNLLPIPDTPADTGGPMCKICHQRVVAPYWYCIDCYDYGELGSFREFDPTDWQ